MDKKNAPAASQSAKIDPSRVPLCSGLGKFATDKHGTLQPVTLTEIENLLANPTNVEKGSAQWVIFSDLISREHAKQREQGRFYALWADFDEPEGLTIQQTAERAAFVIPDRFHVYASRSATETNQKARVIVPLAEPISGGDFVKFQRIFNDKLEAQGLKPDRVTERAGQVCYLPNEGEFYDFKTVEHTGQGFNSSRSWVSELEAIKQQEEAAKQAAEARKVEAIERNSQRAASGTLSPIQAFNEATDLEYLMQRYGYQQIGRRWLPSESTSGSAGVTVKDDRWVSSHDCDRVKGAEGAGGTGGDAFDLFKYYEHGGDQQAALKAAGAMFTTPDGLTITQANQQNYMQQRAQVEALNEQQPEQEQPQVSGVDLLNPPGVAGDICELMQETAKRNRPELYPLAALHLMALVGSQRKSTYTDKLNLITLGIAVTASGKEHGQEHVKHRARSAKCSSKIMGDSGSFRDLIYNLLEGDGVSLYIIDEIHSFLGGMKSKNAQNWETKQEAEILKMSSTSLYTFRGMERRKLMQDAEKEVARLTKKVEETTEEKLKHTLEKILQREKNKVEWLENGLPNPFFSIMGHSTPANLDSFIKLENIESGLLGRALIVRCPETKEKLRRVPVEQSKVDWLELRIEQALENIARSSEIVTPSEEAEQFLEAAIDWYDDDEQRNHSLMGGIYARAPEQLLKVASILGLSGGTITLEMAHYADALVKASISDMKHLLLKSYAESEGAQEQTIRQHAIETIQRNCKGTGLPYSQLKQLVTKPKSWQGLQAKHAGLDLFKELIDYMTEKGLLKLVKMGRRERYSSQS